MSPLKRQLLDRIRQSGPLSFADFMAAALYDPRHGYYASGKASIGREGDFTTSVSTGALFGRLLARQFSECWELLGRPESWILVEQGAFDGRLSCDILEALRVQNPPCFAATTLHIVEPFAQFQARQAATLLAFKDRVLWHSHPLDLPEFTGIHFSNELLDAFPVHKVRRQNGAWMELRVGEENDDFVLEIAPITGTDLCAATAAIPTKEEGFTTEVCLEHGAFFASAALKLRQGWMFVCDYGMADWELAAPHRKDGTLTAYRSQKRHADVLACPGEQDLTAHVNFTAATRSALSSGFSLVGYTDQHRFLTGLVPLHFHDTTEALSIQQQRELLQFRTLTHPQLMGLQFKALCLSKGINQTVLPSGFKHAQATSAQLQIH